MKHLQNMYKTLTIIVVIAAVMVFVAGGVKALSSVSLKSSKPAKTSAKTVKKRIITPKKARNFLNDLDIPTRDYLKMGFVGDYGQYEADSDNIILESKTGERNINNLSYSVFGDKFLAKAVELDMTVNDLSFSSNAIKEFSKYSDHLMFKVTGKHLTPEMKKAMLTKTSGKWVVQGYKIKLKKEIFPDEEPVEGVESTSDHGAFSLSFIIEL